MRAAPFVAREHRLHRFLGIVGDAEQLEVVRRDEPFLQHLVADPVEQVLPVLATDEDDGEVQHLAGLDERQRLEHLVERPEAAGEDDEPLARLHEADLACVEVVEREVDVEVLVRRLLVRQLDVEADREAAAFLRAAVRRLHHTAASAGVMEAATAARRKAAALGRLHIELPHEQASNEYLDLELHVRALLRAQGLCEADEGFGVFAGGLGTPTSCSRR